VKKEEEKAKPKEEPKKAEAKTEEEAEPAEESKKEEKKTETAIGTKEMDEISKKIAAAKGAIAESKPKEVTGGSSGKAAEINSAPETEKGKEKKKEKNGKTKPAAKAEIDAEEAKAKSDSSLTNAFDKKKEEKPKSTSLIIYSDNALEENDEKKIATVYVRIPFKKWMKNVGVKEDYLDIKINVTKEELQNNFKNIVTEIQKKAYTRALAIKDKGGGGLKATYKQNMDDSDYSNQQYVLKPHIDGAVQEELSKEKTKLNK
jgi:hypothetical protein